MREILFRGKRTDNAEWVYGYYTKARYLLNKKEMHMIFEPDVEAFPHCEFTGYEEVLPETVGQYTGLTDKNGVRIFEGDIVKGIAYSVERIGVIVWIDEIASFGVRYFKSVNSTAWENSSILRCASMGKTDEFAAEIIGNIHDNPELLEGGEGNG